MKINEGSGDMKLQHQKTKHYNTDFCISPLYLLHVVYGPLHEQSLVLVVVQEVVPQVVLSKDLEKKQAKKPIFVA